MLTINEQSARLFLLLLLTLWNLLSSCTHESKIWIFLENGKEQIILSNLYDYMHQFYLLSLISQACSWVEYEEVCSLQIICNSVQQFLWTLHKTPGPEDLEVSPQVCCKCSLLSVLWPVGAFSLHSEDIVMFEKWILWAGASKCYATQAVIKRHCYFSAHNISTPLQKKINLTKYFWTSV